MGGRAPRDWLPPLRGSGDKYAEAETKRSPICHHHIHNGFVETNGPMTLIQLRSLGWTSFRDTSTSDHSLQENMGV